MTDPPDPPDFPDSPPPPDPDFPYGTPPTPEQRRAFGEFLASKPPSVQRVLRAYPPWQCYRSTENPRFHYVLLSVSEGAKGKPCTLTLAHGADSTLPGVATFGQKPEQLIACNCGHWRSPTPEQMEATRASLDAQYEAKHGKCDCDDPGHYHNIPQNPVTAAEQRVVNNAMRDVRRQLTRSRGPRGKA